MRSAVAMLLGAVIGLTTSGCVTAPPVTVRPPISQSGSVSNCPATVMPNQDPSLAFTTAHGLTPADPSTTQVLVCRYPVTPVGGVETWQLDAKGVLSGSRATALVTQLNEAPTANPLMKCPSSTIDELWFLETGTTVTAQFWVMLGGCGFASDSSHIVFWRNGDPLTSW